MIPPEKLKPIYNNLYDLDLCKRCILRFLEVSVHDIFWFKNPNSFIQKYELEKKSIEEEGNDLQPTKKSKKNICPVCLNLLTDQVLEDIAAQISKQKADEYNWNDFQVSLTIPKCYMIRFHSMCLYLKQKYKECDASSIIQLQKLIKQLIAPKVEPRIGKQLLNVSPIEVIVHLEYKDDDKEVENVPKLARSRFAPKKFKYENPQIISRNIIRTILEECDDKLFMEYFPVPPTAPETEMYFLRDEWTAAPLFLGGRYLKFQRNISQSPWTVQGELLTPLSVTDILFDAICKYLNVEKSNLTFTASGREDADVRMLGNGRPFYVKIDQIKNRSISPDTLHQIEMEVIKDGLVAVKNLKIVRPSDTTIIKTGEEHKTKVYKALCQTLAPSLDEAVKMINSLISKEIVIAQKTPLRVIHRRAVKTRSKIIHRISATKVEGHHDLFEIELETQAGTYVKEFVNGDLGRTHPNLKFLIGYPTDIIALDVCDVKLEWPPEYFKLEVDNELERVIN